ncbi:MAG: tetratricopeptide repeat protein [Acidobacteriota bacterium]
MPEYPSVLGVFSHRKQISVGSGVTRTGHQKLTYWFVRQISDDTFDIQPLNIYHVPSGMREFIKSDLFLAEYTPDPNYYNVNTVPALRSLYEKITKGEEHLSEGNLDAAEKEFLKALMIDDLNIEANYGLGTVYTEKNDFDKLARTLKVLMGQGDAFSTEHKERLNSFGVRLRRNGHLEQATAFLEKAHEVNPQDDHIMFNLARVYFDKKEFQKCRATLTQALEVNPAFPEARKFLRYCDKVDSAA